MDFSSVVCCYVSFSSNNLFFNFHVGHCFLPAWLDTLVNLIVNPALHPHLFFLESYLSYTLFMFCIMLHVGREWQRSRQRWLLKNDSERYVFVYPAFLSFSLDCCHGQFFWAFVVFWSCVVCNVSLLNELQEKKMYITSFWFPWCPLVSCVSFGYICLYIYISYHHLSSSSIMIQTRPSQCQCGSTFLFTNVVCCSFCICIIYYFFVVFSVIWTTKLKT